MGGCKCARDLPIFLVCHLFDSGAGEDVLYHGRFLPVQRLTEQSALTNREGCATDLFLTGNALARTVELEGAQKSAFKTKTRSFGEFRLTAIRQNHRINKGCRTKPRPTANFCPLVQRQDS